MRWDDGTFRPWPWTLVVNGPSTQTFRYASQDQFVPILPAYSNEFEISFDSAYKGVIKFCESIRLETGYRAIVTLVEPIKSTDDLPPSDEDLEIAYRNANKEADSTWECAVADGLSDEAW